ncbi:MAG: acetyl/propionyl/methylcrotonyl-CoA carboxylase subunit alpha [Aestuariivirga sp.]
MFDKILIANRGEIAVRIAATARRLGIATAAIYSDADAHALHVKMADEAFRVGPAPARQSYLNTEAIIAIAKRSGAEAIHPGYGFLSENGDFAEAVASAGLVFIGPPPAAIRAMGLKDKARVLMHKAGVPVLPGYNGENQSADHLAREAARIGFPILIKPVAGGGGKGMHRVDDAAHLAEALASARREAASSFGDDRVLIEKFLGHARHIEVQIFADAHGHTIHLFERDCSLQRRHQKVIEEAPAPGMTEAMRESMGKAAVAAAIAVGYVGAGTVEFIADVSKGLNKDRFYFMEMNTRLQVEHPVTEMITGVDLVEWQLRIASGEKLPLKQSDLAINGHAIEARLYAEDPAKNFQPQTGGLTYLQFPEGVRIDTGFSQGGTITPHYDPMIAKLIAHGPSRAEALRLLGVALGHTSIGGCRTNLSFLTRLVRDASFAAGDVDTGFIERNIERLATGGPPPPEAIAAALLHALGHLSKPASPSPFDTQTGFELWPGSAKTVKLLTGTTSIQAALTSFNDGKFELNYAGHSLPFVVHPPNSPSPLRGGASSYERREAAGGGGRSGLSAIVLEMQGRVVPMTIFSHDSMLTIEVNGILHEFTTPRSAIQGAESGEGEGNLVIAPMPGLVSIVAVKVGDRVTKGDTIAVTEAMKMEFTLKAPLTGRIATVHAAVGEQVEEGAVIATIEDGDA